MRLEELLRETDSNELVRIMWKAPTSVFTDGDTFKIVKCADRVLYEGYVKGVSRWKEWKKIKGMEVDATYSWNQTINPDGIALNIVVCDRRKRNE